MVACGAPARAYCGASPEPGRSSRATPHTSITLATEVTAATAVSGSGSLWSTRLTMAGPDGTFAIDLLAGNQSDLQEAGGGTVSPIAKAIRVTVDGAELSATLVVAWADDQQAPTGERPWPPSDGRMFRAEDTSGTDSSRIMAGVMPSWLPDAHVVQSPVDGMTDPPGDLVHAVEVPAFAIPPVPGRAFTPTSPTLACRLATDR